MELGLGRNALRRGGARTGSSGLAFGEGCGAASYVCILECTLVRHRRFAKQPSMGFLLFLLCLLLPEHCILLLICNGHLHFRCGIL